MKLSLGAGGTHLFGGGAYSVLAFGCYAVHAVVTEVIVNFGPWKPDRWGSVTEM